MSTILVDTVEAENSLIKATPCPFCGVTLADHRGTFCLSEWLRTFFPEVDNVKDYCVSDTAELLDLATSLRKRGIRVVTFNIDTATNTWQATVGVDKNRTTQGMPVYAGIGQFSDIGYLIPMVKALVWGSLVVQELKEGAVDGG
jgi:hypothetical protein